MTHFRTALLGWLAASLFGPVACLAQDDGIERPGPPALDRFETDENGDDVPDGWYNLRDVALVEGGRTSKGKMFRFEVDQPGRPARASRAFGVDGSKIEALNISFWARLERAGVGDRLGDEPGLVIDFLDGELLSARRGTIGPLTRAVGSSWVKLSKRISVPISAKDAILSIGLLGGTGRLEIDDLAIEPVPRGGVETDDLILNGGFEFGSPAPDSWVSENGVRRSFPGRDSDSSLEFDRPGARALTSLGLPVTPGSLIEIRLSVRARDLRGADGAIGGFFFLDASGRRLPGASGGIPVFRWAGSFDWRDDQATVRVPTGAVHAVFQVAKTSNSGTLAIDDVTATEEGGSRWRPFHVAERSAGRHPVAPSPKIAAGSALDYSRPGTPVAGSRGFVRADKGRLIFADGTRARFFGVSLLPPSTILDTDDADALADRLARSGVDLVRLGDLDAPVGAARSLIDDSREDTKELDAESLAKLFHLIAALEKRGIHIALELQSLRRYRPDDAVRDPGSLPPGGGPAAAFDPTMRELLLGFAGKLLTTTNPETGRKLIDDPALVWVTIAGEISLFDLLTDPDSLPLAYRTELAAQGPGRSGWKSAETRQWQAAAEGLRKLGVRVPIAGVSHWRREPDFNAVQASAGLDLIDDRLFWAPPAQGSPERRSMLWSADGGIRSLAAAKRKSTLPYVAGQYCGRTGSWALPFEGADFLLAALIADVDDWDALVRRGVFINPEIWGSAAPGTAGGEDLFPIPEAINANPQVFALLPHISALYRDREGSKAASADTRPRATAPLAGWEPRRGRLAIDRPAIQGVAGDFRDDPQAFREIILESDDASGVVCVSSVGGGPIAQSKRLLVTAVGSIDPTDITYVDHWKNEPDDIGRPPLLAEPVHARITWRNRRSVKAYALDNTGARVREVPLEATADGPRLVIDGRTPGLHWELVSD
ncbi:MAG: hypothetical protein SFX72_13595 [Isosphaeraceae bacterium]|nr:hypothetical protein [Isosphaeraceae bacterium]